MIVLCKKIICILCVLTILFPLTVSAKNNNVSAQKAVVIDKSTSTVLYQKSSNVKCSMASTTKIMTCLIACEKLKQNDIVTITNKMLEKTEGSHIYLKVGDKITVSDLIKGALLASGNDAANSLAVYTSGSISEFVKLMNFYAIKFGLKNTHFETPSGLDSKNHYSTAYDMAVLTSHALDNETFASVCKLQKADITINGKIQTIYNHNKLLYQTENCIGVKTGFTEKSGRCLVSAYDYKGSTIIIVTLNDYDDWNDHKKLFDYAKNQYKTLSKTQNISIDCVGTNRKKVVCTAQFDVSYLDNLTFKYYYYPILYAPILQNTKVGKTEIYSNNKLIRTVDIIVPESVKVWQTTTK